MYTLRKLALATLFIAVRWSDTAPPSSVQLERSVQKNGMTTNVSSSVEALWNEFKLQYKRFYNDEEEMLRRTIFAENVKAVERHNVLHRKGLRSFKLAINRFADVELSEFAKKFTGYRQQRITTGTERLPLASNLSSNVDKLVDLPHAIDWRLHGLVTPVKDQGDCGSCWAFSATGALEGQQYRKTGKLVALSEQNLVDCSWDFDNRGCEGGTMDGAFQYIMMNKGIDTESSYPYEAQNGQCRYTVYSIGAKDSGFVNVAGGDERKLMETVVTVGPVSAAVDASHPSFRFYHSGVYNEPRCSSVNPNHAVLVVGYGQENGNNYWLVKNSWGESWGESGYMKMSRNGSNQCGIASIASYPRV